MISKSTIAVLTMATLTLTACGGGSKTSSGRRTRTPAAAAVESMDVASIGYRKYRDGLYICPADSAGSCQERSSMASMYSGYPGGGYTDFQQNAYSTLINCVATANGSYDPGNTGEDYTGTPSTSSIATRVQQCCSQSHNLEYYSMGGGPDIMPATSNLKVGEVIINKVNEVLFNGSCYTITSDPYHY